MTLRRVTPPLLSPAVIWVSCLLELSLHETYVYVPTAGGWLPPGVAVDGAASPQPVGVAPPPGLLVVTGAPGLAVVVVPPASAAAAVVVVSPGTVLASGNSVVVVESLEATFLDGLSAAPKATPPIPISARTIARAVDDGRGTRRRLHGRIVGRRSAAATTDRCAAGSNGSKWTLRRNWKPILGRCSSSSRPIVVLLVLWQNRDSRDRRAR